MGRNQHTHTQKEVFFFHLFQSKEKKLKTKNHVWQQDRYGSRRHHQDQQTGQKGTGPRWRWCQGRQGWRKTGLEQQPEERTKEQSTEQCEQEHEKVKAAEQPAEVVFIAGEKTITRRFEATNGTWQGKDHFCPGQGAIGTKEEGDWWCTVEEQVSQSKTGNQTAQQGARDSSESGQGRQRRQQELGKANAGAAAAKENFAGKTIETKR